jgi:hypothetical protein
LKKRIKIIHGKYPTNIPGICCRGRGTLDHLKFTLYYCGICKKDWQLDIATGEVSKFEKTI